MNYLTRDRDLDLLVELNFLDGTSAYALYHEFAVESGTHRYRLTVGDFDAGSTGDDALAAHNQMKWSSPDMDNDNQSNSNCAGQLNAAFWYNACYSANPLGAYSGSSGSALSWEDNGSTKTLTGVVFRARERTCAQPNGLECAQCLPGYYLCTTDVGVLTCCSKPISSCQGANRSGIYEILLPSSGLVGKVYCDMETDGGGWTELLARRDGSLNDFFLQIFEVYANQGYGPVGGDYILPLELWHGVSNAEDSELLVEMTYQTSYIWTRYFDFKVGGRSTNYTLNIQNLDPKGSAGTDLDFSNGMQFSTVDADNDLSENENCAIAFRRPFWNHKCGFVGPLSKSGSQTPGQGIYWQSVTGCCSSLSSIFFKSRRKHCTQMTESLQCSACEAGYKLVTNELTRRWSCQPVCDTAACSHCHSTNPRVCIGSCNPGYFYNEPSRSCQKCESHCATCSLSASQCDTCSNNGVIFQSNCYAECPATFYADEARNCQKCAIEHCKKCTATQCLNCQDGFYFHQGQCVATCPTGFYPDLVLAQCVACSRECTTCTGPTSRECGGCSTDLNYIFKSPSSCVCPDRHFPALADGLCTQCHHRCMLCYGAEPTQCFECLSNYWMKDGSCYRCQDTPGLITESTEVCSQLCGDGRDLGLNQCEDGNNEDGDGCSSTCQIEPNYACRSQSPTGPFHCWETTPPYVVDAYISPDYALVMKFSEPVHTSSALQLIDFQLQIKGSNETVAYSFEIEQPPLDAIFNELRLPIIPLQDIPADVGYYVEARIVNASKFIDVNRNILIPRDVLLYLPPYSIARARVNSDPLVDDLHKVFSSEAPLGLLVGGLFLVTIGALSGGWMWSLIYSLQMASYLPLVELEMPYSLLKLFTSLSFLNLDVEAIEGPLSASSIQGNFIKAEAMSARLEEYRFASSKFLLNCSFILLVGNALIVLLPFIYMCSKVCRPPKCHFCLLSTIRYYRCNLFLRLGSLVYIQVLFSALLNLYQMAFNTGTEAFSSILAVVFLILMTVLPFMVCGLLRRPLNKLSSMIFLQNYGVLVLGFRSDPTAKKYFCLFFFRRLIFTLVLFALRSFPLAQLLVFLLLSFVTLTYLIRIKPLEDSTLQFLETLNQFSLLGLQIIIFTFYALRNSTTSTGGWLCIGVVILTVSINCGVLIPKRFKCCLRKDVEKIGKKGEGVVIPDHTCKTNIDLMDDRTPNHSVSRKCSANWEIMVNSTPTNKDAKHFFSNDEPLHFDNSPEDQDQQSSSDRGVITHKQKKFYKRRNQSCTSSIQLSERGQTKISSAEVFSTFRKASAFDPRMLQEQVQPASAWKQRLSSSSMVADLRRESSNNFSADLVRESSNNELTVPSFYPQTEQSSRSVVSYLQQPTSPTHSQQQQQQPSLQPRRSIRPSLSFNRIEKPRMTVGPRLSNRELKKSPSREEEDDRKYKTQSFWGQAKKANKTSSFKRVKMAFK